MRNSSQQQSAVVIRELQHKCNWTVDGSHFVRFNEAIPHSFRFQLVASQNRMTGVNFRCEIHQKLKRSFLFPLPAIDRIPLFVCIHWPDENVISIGNQYLEQLNYRFSIHTKTFRHCHTIKIHSVCSQIILTWNLSAAAHTNQWQVSISGKLHTTIGNDTYWTVNGRRWNRMRRRESRKLWFLPWRHSLADWSEKKMRINHFRFFFVGWWTSSGSCCSSSTTQKEEEKTRRQIE